MPKSKSKKVKVTVKRKAARLTLGQRIRKVLVGYFTTQFILMVFVGVCSWAILNALHVGSAVLLGVITGVLSGIPGIGMLISTVAAALVAVMDGVPMWNGSQPWLEGLIVLVIYFVFNKLVDWIIAPLFLGKVTKANPFVIIILVGITTLIFGPFGGILAMPIYLIIKTTIEYYHEA